MRRAWRRGGALLALAVLVAGCQGPGHTTPAHVKVPRDFIGVSVSPGTGAVPPAEKTAAAISDSGAGMVRELAPWLLMEPAPGRLNLGFYDVAVAAAAQHGLTVLPVVVGAPAWAVRPGTPVKAGGELAPPRSPAQLDAFLRRLVRRYGPAGTLWRRYPSLPRHPIRAWQVWNEPNLPQYWAGRPDAAAYVALLRSADRAIHRADPGATVVSAGVADSKLGVPFARWLRRFYAAGARGTFDALAVHAYAPTGSGVADGVRRARLIMGTHGDGRTPIWLTEFGWADGGPPSAFTVTPRDQADDLGQALTLLAGQRTRLGLAKAMYYQWQDDQPGPGDTWGHHTGLLASDGRTKPAYRAFRDAVKALVAK